MFQNLERLKSHVIQTTAETPVDILIKLFDDIQICVLKIYSTTLNDDIEYFSKSCLSSLLHTKEKELAIYISSKTDGLWSENSHERLKQQLLHDVALLCS